MNHLQRALKFQKVFSRYSHSVTGSCCCYNYTREITLYPKCTLAQDRTFHQYPQNVQLHQKEGIIRKCRNRIAAYLAQQRLRRSGYYLLESIIDKINYSEFFKVLNLTDSFYSWFVVTELHIWMLIVRLMAEGEEGRHVRNLIMQALWTDVLFRVKKLQAGSFRGEISELSEQLNAALIAYDEGLLSEDVVLAGALWRRLYQQDPLVSLESLHLLVQYVRKQMKILDAMTKYELFEERNIKWARLQA